MLERHWLENWFVELKDDDDECFWKWLKTQVRIYVVPLIGWDYENFYKVGSIFGRVISVDHSNFHCAWVIILTDCLFMINCKIILEIEDWKYKIFISETLNQSFWLIIVKNIQKGHWSHPNHRRNFHAVMMTFFLPKKANQGISKSLPITALIKSHQTLNSPQKSLPNHRKVLSQLLTLNDVSPSRSTFSSPLLNQPNPFSPHQVRIWV